MSSMVLSSPSLMHSARYQFFAFRQVVVDTCDFGHVVRVGFVKILLFAGVVPLVFFHDQSR